jgi:hypothetical protein
MVPFGFIGLFIKYKLGGFHPLPPMQTYFMDTAFLIVFQLVYFAFLLMSAFVISFGGQLAEFLHNPGCPEMSFVHNAPTCTLLENNRSIF